MIQDKPMNKEFLKKFQELKLNDFKNIASKDGCHYQVELEDGQILDIVHKKNKVKLFMNDDYLETVTAHNPFEAMIIYYKKIKRIKHDS